MTVSVGQLELWVYLKFGGKKLLALKM